MSQRLRPTRNSGTTTLAALTAAFNALRDANITDDDRLACGRLLCEELYVKCGGNTKEVSE